jgi:hypothetical protein
MTRAVLIWSALALLLAASLAGCKDNEESFYIEHMKKIADPPDCKYSNGDPAISTITVDLSLRQAGDFFGFFQVTNALMAREDYDNLKAESNGIFVDGSEAVVTVGDESVGGSTFSGATYFINAETTDVMPSIAIGSSVFGDLAAEFSCPYIDDMLGEMVMNLLATGETGLPAGYSDLLGSGYVTVRLLGHSQGGIEVETNQFTVAANFCCGCMVDLSTCASPCGMFCEEPEQNPETCQWGIDSWGLTCTGAAYNLSADWENDEPDVVDGGTELSDCELEC